MHVFALIIFGRIDCHIWKDHENIRERSEDKFDFDCQEMRGKVLSRSVGCWFS